MQASRPYTTEASHRTPELPAAASRPAPVRSLAVNALALTGAAVTVLNPARAVTLGEVAVESRLGQPLAARVPVGLAAGEMLGAACVSVPAGAAPDLSALPAPVVSVPEGTGPGGFELRVTTTQPLYEPMYELQLQVRCPGTALVVRQYVLMLDLPTAVAPPVATAAGATVVSAGPASAAPVAGAAPPPAAARRTAPRRVLERPAEPIVGGTRYRVSSGDTLSTIAARVGGTGESLWARADRIFAANPDAFIDGNPDLIKLGSEIVIPVPGDAAAVTAAAAPASPATGRGVDPLAVPALPEPAPVAAPGAPATVAPADAGIGTPPAETVQEAPADPFAAALENPLAPVAAVEVPVGPQAAPVFQDEQPLVATRPGPGAVAGPAPAPPAETSPWLAALVGILVGAAVSVGLLRERLLEALRGLKPGRRPAAAAPGEAAAAAAAAAAETAPVARRGAPSSESTMVVVEGHLDEDTDQLLAQRIERTDERPAPVAPVQRRVAAPAGDPATDLSRLFHEPTPTATIADDLVAALPAEPELDLDLSAATPDVTIDQEIAWLGDDTALTPTQEMNPLAGSGGDTVEQVDLQTLSQLATSDQQVSQTLKEALNLLENDYEDELTASQVVDKRKLEEILDDDADDDTLVRTGTDQIPRR
jgi:murein DD-endopeptidase MepM/ murein hydrolase activator NlpD